MKYLLATCVYNEGAKIKRVLQKFNDYKTYDVLVIDDGSTDHFVEDLGPLPLRCRILRFPINRGVGASIRQALQYAREGNYDVVIFIAGNDKDCPDDVRKLVDAIELGYDFVQGSRYLPGGDFGNLPFYRKIATRYIHPLLFTLVTGRRTTDSTNGFRAIRLSLLNDSRIQLDQDWLDQYELEPYLFYKAIQLGYRVTEVPVTKIYPSEKEYSKIKPIVGWWSILRPLVLLGLGIKK